MESPCILYFLSVDPFLGKIDKASLSQQTLMELLTESITNRENVCGSQEYPEDISEWKGLTFNTSNEIINIRWPFKDLNGPIELEWLPSTLQEALVLRNLFIGSADLTCLPDSLELLNLGSNLFGGTIDLTRLPSTLQKIFLYNNRFEGQTDFRHLPESLTYLDVKDTNLKGEVYEFAGTLHVDNSLVKDRRKK